MLSVKDPTINFGDISSIVIEGIMAHFFTNFEKKKTQIQLTFNKPKKEFSMLNNQLTISMIYN